MDIFSDKVFSFSVVLAGIAVVLIFAIWCFGDANDFATRRLYFAAGILTGLGLVFVLSMGMYYWEPDSSTSVNNKAGKEIFEACMKILPPIITLVIGYYFGASKNENAETNMDHVNKSQMTHNTNISSNKAIPPDKTMPNPDTDKRLKQLCLLKKIKRALAFFTRQ